MKPDQNIKTRVFSDALKRLKELKIEDLTNLFICEDVLVKGEVLETAPSVKPLDRDTIFVLADRAPRHNWAHPCEYLFYDAKTGELYKKIPASFPPSSLMQKSITPFHEPMKPIDLFKQLVPPVFPYKPVEVEPLLRHKYAILFAGRAENRHVNDLEFLYRTLVDNYGFSPSNIQVLNHDGTVNYFLQAYSSATINTSPLIFSHPLRWPGDDTPYRMVVNGPGTRAGFQAAIAAIAGKIHFNDLLLIHTSNHGAGPCDFAGNYLYDDYCLIQYDAQGDWVPYYQNDFIADLRVLPRFGTLMVMMEQCRSGGFIAPIINLGLATNAHVATAVSANDYSYGGKYFDKFANDWTAALHKKYPDGSGLSAVVDTDNDGRVSAAEAFDYADSIHHHDGGLWMHCPLNNRDIRYGDSPTSSASPPNCGKQIWLDG